MQGLLVDPDVTHTIDPATETIGGNAIFDNSKNLHSAWDAPPTNFHLAHATDLLPAAQRVAKDNDRLENWSFAWASDVNQGRPASFCRRELCADAAECHASEGRLVDHLPRS
jgi:hypothetical protein